MFQQFVAVVVGQSATKHIKGEKSTPTVALESTLKEKSAFPVA